MPRIPLIEDLTTQPIPPGSNLLIEFDSSSQWYNAALTIAAGWLRAGGRTHYSVSVQPADDVRSQLNRLGLNVESLEREDRLRIFDWYSLALGRKSTEKHPAPSLKVFDLSPEYSAWMKSGELGENAETLRVIDNGSLLARFNEEKLWVEFVLSRVFPRGRVWKATVIYPLVRGIHNDTVYKMLEAGADGVVDFKLDEASDPPKNFMRIRNLGSVPYDACWHELKITYTMEVKLEK